VTLSDLVAAIDAKRRHGNLSSVIRVFVLDFNRNRLPDEREGPDVVPPAGAGTPRSLFQS
jgi:predicted DNA-binding ribbon-helix-helix protein